MRSVFSPSVTQYQLNPEELAALIRAAIQEGHIASFKAPGNSMIPIIRSGDKIFVAPVKQNSVHVGDVIVFVQVRNGHVLAHRVVQLKSNRMLCKGDNVANSFDGWTLFEGVLGRVIKVQREGKPVHFGLGIGKKWIAYLSRKNWLVPLIDFFRKVKWIVIGLFTTKGRPSER